MHYLRRGHDFLTDFHKPDGRHARRRVDVHAGERHGDKVRINRSFRVARRGELVVFGDVDV